MLNALNHPMRRVLVPHSISAQAPAVDEVVHSLNGLTMGTSWSVSLVAKPTRSLAHIQSGIQHELDTVVMQMSTWESSSNLSQYNQAESGTWHTLPDEFLYVLQYALDVAKESGGAYDPTSGALVNVWGFGPTAKQTQRPDQSILDAALDKVGWQKVLLDSNNKRALQPGGVYLDFSAIAKGFAVDQIARFLAQSGIESYLVEVGGEVRGAGIKPDALPWWVVLEQPLPFHNQQTKLTETVIALHNLSVATSGDYRRYFTVSEGNTQAHYSHTIDPRTGEPIQHGLAAVTVIHRDCITADAVSTALNVLGAEAGLAFATKHSIPALFITRTNDGFIEQMTPEFLALTQLD